MVGNQVDHPKHLQF